MADLFQLPNGTRVRKGASFTLERQVDIVEPAIVGVDKQGNQRIEKEARVTKTKAPQYFPDNWLHLAGDGMLEQYGIVPLEEDPPANDRFYFTSEGPVKKGRLTQIVTPRDVDDIARGLIAEVKDRARSTILATFSLEKQATMARRIADIERMRANGDKVTDEQNELYDTILEGQGWIEDVLLHSDRLEAEVEKLKSAKAAEAWYAKPWEWPEYDK